MVELGVWYIIIMPSPEQQEALSKAAVRLDAIGEHL